MSAGRHVARGSLRPVRLGSFQAFGGRRRRRPRTVAKRPRSRPRRPRAARRDRDGWSRRSRRRALRDAHAGTAVQAGRELLDLAVVEADRGARATPRRRPRRTSRRDDGRRARISSTRARSSMTRDASSPVQSARGRRLAVFARHGTDPTVRARRDHLGFTTLRAIGAAVLWPWSRRRAGASEFPRCPALRRPRRPSARAPGTSPTGSNPHRPR